MIDTGNSNPSKEGRDHAVWLEHGLLSVTGGKLTTFRLIALDALKRIEALLPQGQGTSGATPLFAPGQALPNTPGLTVQQRQRLQGHYGAQAVAVLAAAQAGELQSIAGTHTLWVQLRWAARAEAVVHLEDLLLRRTRLGLLLKGGGADLLPRIRALCQPELGWSDAHWEQEQAAYLALWQAHYRWPAALESSHV
ncbi:glycerol-3-phosphate dehydrogenase [mine drainage metagenome]|uniref:Glycerol-3-phosphate dehydrogenase n=1 Tax=mine drainage metagenome TaxID=410659 RepID=A0A1J5PLX1_9ZZZZ